MTGHSDDPAAKLKLTAVGVSGSEQISDDAESLMTGEPMPPETPEPPPVREFSGGWSHSELLDWALSADPEISNDKSDLSKTLAAASRKHKWVAFLTEELPAIIFSLHLFITGKYWQGVLRSVTLGMRAIFYSPRESTSAAAIPSPSDERRDTDNRRPARRPRAQAAGLVVDQARDEYQAPPDSVVQQDIPAAALVNRSDTLSQAAEEEAASDK